MRALVTGAAGFIGSRLAARLLDRGATVTAVDAFTGFYEPTRKRANLAPLIARTGFELVEANLLDDGWQDHLADVEVVFHLAAQPGVRSSWGEGFQAYAENNVFATQRLLEAVRAHHPDPANSSLRRFVYASSSSVYGDAMTFPTDEDALPRPHSPYGVTKLSAEHLCGVYARNWAIPTVSLRYFTVYGGGQRPDMALHRMIEAARGGSAFPLFGDGSQRRDFTHVDDIVAANLAATEADLTPGEVINVAGGSDATVRDLLRLVELAAGAEVPVDQRPTQAGDVKRTGANTTKAREQLGWSPKVGLTVGIAEQVAWQIA